MKRFRKSALGLTFLTTLGCGTSTPPPPTVRDLTCPGVDVLARDQLQADQLRVNQSSLFWLSFHTQPPGSFSGSLPSDIVTMSKAGATPQALALVNSDSLIGVTDTDLFFTLGDAGSFGPSTVLRQSLSGGAATSLGDYSAPVPLDDGSHAYVYERNVSGGRVLQVADGGSALQPIASTAPSEQIMSMVIVDTGVAFTTRTLNPTSYTVWTIPTPGAPPATIASGLAGDFDLRAAAGGVVYGWVQDIGGSQLSNIQTLPTIGGAMTPLFPFAFKSIGDIVIVGSAIYFVGQQPTDADLGVFVVEPGGAPKRVDCGYFSGYSLATDGTYLYWGQDTNTKASVFRMLAPGP